MKSFKLIDKLCDISINCEEDLAKVRDKFEEYGIIKYKIDCDLAFNSPGYDAYYYAISYIYKDELELLTGTFACY